MKYSLSEETLGYQTSDDPSNADKRLLVAGSKNVQIDYQKKVKIRSGYTRLGAANTALTNVRNAWTWSTSTGHKHPQRFYDDELEVYLRTIDTYAINAWTRIKSGWSTTERLRNATWFDTTEKIDLQLMVNGDSNLYEWGGGVAVVDSITSVTITKKGTTTFAQNRFYTTRNKTLVCVRTGTEYVYTGGETTTTLTGIADTTGLQANDILIQKVITVSNKPASGYTNHTIFSFQNQLLVGSEDNNQVYLSKDDDYDDFTFASPRITGDGALLTLDEPNRGFGTLGSSLIIFSGKNYAYKVVFESITVSTTLSETVTVKRLETGVNQGALCQEAIVPIGDSLAYLSNEVALRIISDPEKLVGITPKTFSNPIKPDFDNEVWLDSSGNPDAFGIWYKNMLIFSAPQGSHLYMLNFLEDADGKLLRFWNPPQVLPVGAMSIIDSGTGNDLSNGDKLHGHSNSIPETFLLFDGASDGLYSGMDSVEKLPIDARAVFAYQSYGKRADLKTFDEFYVEGEITPNTTDLTLGLNYDYEGTTAYLEKIIDGSDGEILEGPVGANSLAQQSLALNPLGGLLNVPSNARKFRIVFEIAKEDFNQLQDIYSTNEIDRYWAIIARGTNATLSPRKKISNKK